MQGLKLSQKFKDLLDDFVLSLKNIYKDGLISIILYGSAVSGEFSSEHSNINLMVVLDNTTLENLNKISKIINKHKFQAINPLFFTEDYIKSSQDVFPIEFLDMQENYTVLYGKDVLKDLSINIRNLRFQCEQELKAKLLNLRQLYLKFNKNKIALCNLLFKSFTSILHILRNLLRLKGKQPPYLKQDILQELTSEFQIDMNIWQKILAAKNKQIKLSSRDIQEVFIIFERELEKIVSLLDKL